MIMDSKRWFDACLADYKGSAGKSAEYVPCQRDDLRTIAGEIIAGSDAEPVRNSSNRDRAIRAWLPVVFGRDTATVCARVLATGLAIKGLWGSASIGESLAFLAAVWVITCLLAALTD